jgi:hypothetical protein
MFGIEKYKSLLSDLKEEGLVPSTNWIDNKNINSLFLRHDIDFSIEYAHQLATLEFDQGINATYFFMFSSNMYNLISNQNQRLAKEISDMGHKISIHFDPTSYKSLDRFKGEKDLFESLFNTKIDIVSIHRPGPFLNNNNISLGGIPQTYNDLYFKKMKYISDSGGKNIFPQISEYLKSSREKALHLLIHPIWWVGEGVDATSTLDSWIKANQKFLSSEVRLNCKTYKG